MSQAERGEDFLRLEVSPDDEHNRTLLANVHPPDWVNPEPAARYNLVVIGAGTAGLVTAAGAVSLGAKVAIVERNLFGGDCLNVGCVPSKAVIRASRSVAEFEFARSLGASFDSRSTPDFSAVMERMRRIRARISRHDSAARFQDLGVDVFIGSGRFTGRDTVAVEGKELRFSRAVIATGARAVAPPIEGLAAAGFLTNETVFNLTELPARLLVLGGGPIGCELSQAFQRLGSRVTIAEMSEHFLPREDPEAAKILADSLRRDGVDVRLHTKAVHVAVNGGVNGNEKQVHLEANGRTDVVPVDAILVGVGRAPNVQGLGLKAAGVHYDARKGVQVEETLRTSNSRIYAAGDVCLPYKFTHTADATARIVIQNSLFLGRKKWSALTIPWCTYTDPEIAHVGIYEREAGARGIQVDTYHVPMSEVDRAIADGEEEGFVKVHVRKGTDKILGATIVARHAGEMISEITLAMVNGVGLGSIANVIHPYPTQAEAIRKAGDAYNRTRLTPRVQALLGRWLGWSRSL